MRSLLAFLLACISLSSSAQNLVWKTPYANWQMVNISANGKVIHIPTFVQGGATGGTGYYYSSLDAGKTWLKRTNSGARAWVFGCTSSDGSIVYGAEQGGLIYKSSDSGATWASLSTQPGGGGTQNWEQVSCSSDGNEVVACIGSVSNGDIFTSKDGGNSWTDQTGALSRNWVSCTMTGDGTKIAASNAKSSGNNDGLIYVSTNWQTGSPTWNGNSPSTASLAAVTYCRSGTLYAAFNGNGNDSHVYVSTNNGSTWGDVNPTPDQSGDNALTRNWNWTGCSADGQTVVASCFSLVQCVWVSTNGGTTWIQVIPLGGAWPALADDASVIALSQFNGNVFVSYDKGVTWLLTTAQP